jgi:acetoin utilization transport system ATP-binding protein
MWICKKTREAFVMMIQMSGISHQFTIGKRAKEKVVPVLKNIHLQVEKGEIMAIVGRSGSGKSTLLNLMSGYITPTEGRIVVAGQDVTRLTEGQWADFRLANFGFIFQSFQLIPGLTAAENVELPLVLKGVDKALRKRRTEELLEQVGMAECMSHYPGELSGGQQQRVSVARALVMEPPIVLADEPTGSLDSENEKSLLTMIRQLNHELGITFVIITHDEQVAAIANRTLRLRDGAVQHPVPVSGSDQGGIKI